MIVGLASRSSVLIRGIVDFEFYLCSASFQWFRVILYCIVCKYAINGINIC